ncbi:MULTISPECIES: ANTAR domain-containing response regulator [unclassified Colwellia]|uniref:ANTAR domain-containing response regulator n=1 Tax=unclassified Colwellia TaxID=196834 RepID=UPI00287074CD|nr:MULTISPECIES: ANTAR domain-containing protein [unclassified Colwellia]
MRKKILSSSKISNKNQDITAKLKVLLAENNPIKAKALMSILSNAEYDIYHIAHSGVPLLRDVEQLNPDVIIIDIESPNRDMLENLNQISQFAPKPIIVFSEQQNTHTTINQMVKSGVSAYVVGEVNQTRVKSIIDVAIARFEVFQGLKRELADTKQKLSSQKNIDKAKRWLMETKQLSEIDAYHFIRKIAMDNSQKMDDVAKNILSVASIF